MSLSVYVLANHEAGYALVQKLLTAHHAGECRLLGLSTAPRPAHAWWPDPAQVVKDSDIAHHMFENEAELVTHVGERPDWLLLLSWPQVLRGPLLDWPRKGIVNLHLSLLPRHRGVMTAVWPLLAGETEAGITYHRVDRGIDTGNILLQRRVPVHTWDDCRSLLQRLNETAIQAFDELWGQRQHWEELARPQVPEHASYHSRKDFEALHELDLDAPTTVRQVLNHLRALSFPPHAAHAWVRCPDTGKRIRLSLALWPEEDNDSKPAPKG
jgi:methionyl-tRNA formyltransferase